MGGRAGTIFSPRNDASFLHIRTCSTTSAPQLRTSRSGGEAAMVGDKVYLVGGFDFDVLSCVHALSFRPQHTALAPESPSAGEKNRSTGVSAPAETSMLRLRPANVWKPMPRLKTARTRFGMCSLYGMLWVFGGADSEGEVLSSVEVFNPRTKTWMPGAQAMPTARQGVGVVALGGLIYVMGGADDEGLPLDIVEVYDPVKGTWREEQPMRQKRERFGISVLDSCIFVAGGFGEVGQPVADVEVFDSSLPPGAVYLCADYTTPHAQLSRFSHPSRSLSFGEQAGLSSTRRRCAGR